MNYLEKKFKILDRETPKVVLGANKYTWKINAL